MEVCPGTQISGGHQCDQRRLKWRQAARAAVCRLAQLGDGKTTRATGHVGGGRHFERQDADPDESGGRWRT